MRALAIMSDLCSNQTVQPSDESMVPEPVHDLGPARRLVEAVQELSLCRDVEGVMRTVRTAARQLSGADGATFVLRDGNLCYYADEDAISPLWKGRRFPIQACISGWVMEHGEPVVIDDVFADPRIPIEAYRSTFVRSLTMVPIRREHPIGAIGCYWARQHRACADQVQVIQALADSTSTAMENVRLYDELARRVQQAEEAVQLRDEFLVAAAHELRTPLTTLQLQLDLLARATPSNLVTSAERVVRARASSLRLAELIAMMLDASQLTVNDLRLAPSPCDLVAILNSVIERSRAEADRRACTLLIDAPLSACGQWDRSRIEQVVAVLVAYALRRARGKTIAIRMETGQALALSVRDEGPSIPASELSKLFDRFARVGTDAKAGGLGLGLYLVRLTVEAHGGRVWAESGVTGGMTVNVSLPWVCKSWKSSPGEEG